MADDNPGMKPSLEERLQRLEITNLYRSVTHRLVEIYDDQRAAAAQRTETSDRSSATEQIAQMPEVSFGVNEAARRLDCSAKTVHKLCQGKRLSFQWVGNKRRFRPEDLDNFWKTRWPDSKERKICGRVDNTSRSSIESPKHAKGGDQRGSGREPGNTEVSKAHRLKTLSEEMRNW